MSLLSLSPVQRVAPIARMSRVHTGWAGAALSALVLAAGCASMKHEPEPSVVSGNLWSRQLEQKRQVLTGNFNGTGIQVARTGDNQLQLNVPGDFSFNAGRAELKTQMRPVLDELSRDLSPEVRVTIVGQAAAQNEVLSASRAEAVRDYLVRRGISRNRLAVEEGPEGKRDAAAGNMSRRVEIYLAQPAS